MSLIRIMTSKNITGILLETDIEIIPDLVKTAFFYGKRYITNQIGSILRDWSLDDVLEGTFPFEEN